MTNVKLYILDISFLNEKKMFEYYRDKMSTYRQKKVDAFRFFKDKALSVASGILLNYELEKVGLQEKDMQYCINMYGKPMFVNNQAFEFNLSHSGTKALLGVIHRDDERTTNINFGCDIEAVDNFEISIAKSFFANSEYKYILNGLALGQAEERFFQIWTLKESFVKAVGRGMSLQFRDFSVVDQRGELRILEDANQELYSFFQYADVKDYKIACCCNDENMIVEINDLSNTFTAIS